jgi:hypothetical protein
MPGNKVIEIINTLLYQRRNRNRYTASVNILIMSSILAGVEHEALKCVLNTLKLNIEILILK